MIPLLYLWQGHSGAARRKKVDTPPLAGRRMATYVAIERLIEKPRLAATR